MSLYCSAFSVNRYSRKISDVLICTRKLVKQCCFSAILVTCKRKCQLRVLWKRIFSFFGVITSVFAKPRVRLIFNRSTGYRFFSWQRLYGNHFNFFRICKSERKLIAVNTQFHRIAHRGIFCQRYLCSGNHSHIQKVLPERAFSAHSFYYGGFSNLKFL